MELVNGITYADLQVWIDGLFNYLLAEQFYVAGVQFSLWDVFCGGVVLSIFGFACGKLYYDIFDNR